MSTEEGARSYARTVEMLADGSAQIEMSEELHGLLMALGEEAKARSSKVKGSMTVTLDLSVEPTGIVGVDYSIKTKKPDPRRPGSVLWLTKGGNLSPQNPRQQNLPLREVGGSNEGPAREVRDAGAREV